MQWAPPNPNLRAAVAQMLGPSPTPMAQPAMGGFPAPTGAGISPMGEGVAIGGGGGTPSSGGGGGGGSLDLSGMFSQLTASSGGGGTQGNQMVGLNYSTQDRLNPNSTLVQNGPAQQAAHERRQAALAAQAAAESRRRQQQANAAMFAGVSTGFGGPKQTAPTNPFQAQGFSSPSPQNNATNNGPMAQAFGSVFPTGGLF